MVTEVAGVAGVTQDYGDLAPGCGSWPTSSAGRWCQPRSLLPSTRMGVIRIATRAALGRGCR
jgi:hypothetical protein